MLCELENFQHEINFNVEIGMKKSKSEMTNLKIILLKLQEGFRVFGLI